MRVNFYTGSGVALAGLFMLCMACGEADDTNPAVAVDSIAGVTCVPQFEKARILRVEGSGSPFIGNIQMKPTQKLVGCGGFPEGPELAEL